LILAALTKINTPVDSGAWTLKRDVNVVSMPTANDRTVKCIRLPSHSKVLNTTSNKLEEDGMPVEFKHIVRLAGKDLSGEKRVQLALADLKGVSVMMARAVAYAAKVNPMVKLGSLDKEEIKRLEEVVSQPQAHGVPGWMLDRRKDQDTGKDIHIIGAEIDRRVRADIALERRVRSRRGIRHELGLPVRGQRTRSTGRRGMVVGVKRKEIRIREAEAAAKRGEAPKRGKVKEEKPAEEKEAKEEK